jgi:HD-GYP domain-containing protein (c-di-GMP phosphodiesterase class II)
MADRTGSSGIGLADVLTAMSLATDLGLGQPSEHMQRSSRIGRRLGERLGLDGDALRTLHDVTLLTYVGCPVYGNDVARALGDDIEFRSRVPDVDLVGFPAMVFMLRRAGASGSALERARRIGRLVTTKGKDVLAQMADHCAAAGDFAERLGLGGIARQSIEYSYARWDGRGFPPVGGDDIPLPARIAHVAEASEVFHRTSGTDAAVEVATTRAGTHFAPDVVAALERDPEPLFAGLDREPDDDATVSRPPLSETDLDVVLEAMADFCDLRCPYFAGHGRGTADLAMRAGEELRFSTDTAALLRRAALVHDMGRAGVPGSIWDKPGPLSATELERMRLHAYLVERMFSRPEPLRRIGVLASSHHERMDGSGYHRGLSGTLVAAPARVLAAADAYHAMSQPRPHRPARAPDEAATELRRDVDAGRLDPVAADAVLSAAGHRAGARRGGGPAGLTARESEVLALLAQGLPNKRVALELDISPKTVGNHVERIYTKIGVTSRAAAALYAMRHGLVDQA